MPMSMYKFFIGQETLQCWIKFILHVVVTFLALKEPKLSPQLKPWEVKCHYKLEAFQPINLKGLLNL